MSACAFSLVATLAAHGQTPTFIQTNLVTNNPAVHAGQITDANLVDPWGVSFSSAGPIWVSNARSGTSTLYRIDPITDATSKVPLTVAIPGAGSPTGQNFNTNTASGAFNGDNFLFVSLDGTISGWRGALGTAAETLQTASTANTYTGSAFATIAGHSYLYAANFKNGTIDVVKGDVGAPNLTGTFTDPNLPAGYTPFNTQILNGKIYVAFVLRSGAFTGSGGGVIDTFDLNGNFLSRVGSQGTLVSPWGLTIAPTSFGSYAGDLLVGNFGNGLINAYDLASNSFVGQLSNQDGSLVSIAGLWSLTTGNNGGSGSANELYFTAGPERGSNGILGSLRAVPEPGQVAYLLGIGATGLGFAFRMRRRRKA